MRARSLAKIRRWRQRDLIAQVYRLHHRPHLVIPVRPLPQDLQRPVDLGRRDRPDHGLAAAVARCAKYNACQSPSDSSAGLRPGSSPALAMIASAAAGSILSPIASEFRRRFRGAAKPALASARNEATSSTSTSGSSGGSSRTTAESTLGGGRNARAGIRKST